MKIFNFILFLFYISITNAQTENDVVYKSKNRKFSVTTETEYNYMSKGYKVQVENGLDMKKGYIIEKTVKLTDNGYKFEFTPLDRITGKDTVCVGFIVKATMNTTDTWFAIPIDGGDLFNSSMKDIYPQKLNNAYYVAAFARAYYIFSLSYFIGGQ